MKKTLFSFFFSLLALSLLVQASPVAAAGIGTVTGIRGDATVRHEAAPQPQSLKFKDDVQWQDTLNTGADSRLRLLILQKSVVTMKEQSQLQLREEAISPTQPKKKSILNLLSGSIRAVVEKDALKDSDYEVHTNVAVAAIRGSDLIGERTSPNEANFYTGPGAAATVIHTNPAIGTRDLAELSRARVLPTAIDITRITLDQFRSLAAATAPKGAQANNHRAEVTLASVETRAVSQAVTETVRAVVAHAGVGALTPRGEGGRGPGGGEDRGPLVGTNLITPATTNLGSFETFRAQLTWGSGATDLDSHLTGPSNSRFHVFFDAKGNSDLSVSPNAFLHSDHTGTSGSEVISFQMRRNGSAYRFSAFNFGSSSSTSTNLTSASNAQVQLIRGGTVSVNSSTNAATVSGGTVIQTFNVPTSGTGNTWRVFEATGPSTGVRVGGTPTISTLNQITTFSTSSNVD